NGYSGFFPEPYMRLAAALERRPIPESVWAQMGGLGGCLLVYHPHVREGLFVAAYAEALERPLASGGLELVRSFPHEDDRDFVFAAAGAAWADRLRENAGDRAPTRSLFDARIAKVREDGMRLAPPFGYLDAPREGGAISPRDWAFGWV